VPANSYKNLIVYQKAENLTKDIIEYFSKFRFPRSKEFAVVQLLRAVASIGANIAEGYGRHYQKYYHQFLAIARGSSFETDYWLSVVANFPELNRAKLANFASTNTEISKILTTLMKKLDSK
jgi:four helix bundle protein